MSSDLISKRDLIAAFKQDFLANHTGNIPLANALSKIASAPPVTTAWQIINGVYTCSRCGCGSTFPYNYCPGCGAAKEM